MSAGYSGTPLVKKLGIKPGARLYLDGAPPHYFELLGSLPEDVVISPRLSGEFDFLHLFVDKAARLRTRISKLKAHLKPAGMIWISWPKGSSKLATDVNGALVRETGLAAGLVDIKVCAVDEDWSGHKFVIPVANRPKSTSRSTSSKGSSPMRPGRKKAKTKTRKKR